MRKLRVLLASCVAAATLAAPLAAPAGADEPPDFDCVLVWTDYVVTPDGWALIDLVETGDTWRVRGDLALEYAGQVVTRWRELTAEYAACVAAFAEAAGGYAASEAQRLAACVAAAAAPLLTSDPLTSRYVEVGLDGLVEIHVVNARDDVVALFNCNGVLLL